MHSWTLVAALLTGAVVGLFFGDLTAPLEVFANGFIKLLEMTVLPYLVVSIISSLGGLTIEEARRLVLRAGAVLLGLWVIAVVVALSFPIAFPSQATGRFFTTALIERGEPLDFVALYIPSNPFRSLADGIVPAVVLFSVILGLAMIGLERKSVLLDVLSAAHVLVHRAARLVERLLPYGMFAIAAHAAGTLRLEQLQHIRVYLLTYVAMALVGAFWVLPGLVAALTPVGHGELLARTRRGMITAFMAGDLFVVLPVLADASKALLARHHLTDAHTRDLPEIIVPASFNFPHFGKLLALSFVLFAGWLADASLSILDYPRLAVTGVLATFGSLEAAVPFLLDLFHVPIDALALLAETGVLADRFGALVAAVHTVALGVLGTSAMTGRLHLRPGKLMRFGLVTLVLTLGTLGGLRWLFASVLYHEFQGAAIVYGMDTVFEPVEPTARLSAPARGSEVAPQSHARDVRQRGILRVCILPQRMPYVYENAEGRPTGFDFEMANRLAHDLEVGLQLVPATMPTLPATLAADGCDLAMAGIQVTPLRASAMRFSEPYLDETLAWVVRDHLRHDFATWDSIRALEPLRAGAPDVPYYIDEVRERVPGMKLEVVPEVDSNEQVVRFDAFLMPAERGAVQTMLRPEFSVVVPSPEAIKVPLAYPVSTLDPTWPDFVNTWIGLKRRDGTIERLYRHWILGHVTEVREPRWSILRNVLHWPPASPPAR